MFHVGNHPNQVDHPPRRSRTLGQALGKAGYQAFWVGSCVRDAQLGQSPKDYDIATDAKPDDIERLFRKTIPVGKHLG